MKKDYICPYCKGKLKVKDFIVFSRIGFDESRFKWVNLYEKEVLSLYIIKDMYLKK